MSGRFQCKGALRSAITGVCVVLLMAAAGSARAQGEILVQEILPSLTGTELGLVVIAPAPLPGTSMTVRRSDVLRALERAGYSGRDLQVPRATRITREIVSLSKDVLLDEAQAALAEAALPCSIQVARVTAEARVIAGPREIRAELPKRGSFGQSASAAQIMQTTGALYIDSGGRSVRVPVTASLSCPPPDVLAGSQVTAVARVGVVKATAPAEAKQAGRVGEIIRITNKATGAALKGRVVDPHTVEVVP